MRMFSATVSWNRYTSWNTTLVPASTSSAALRARSAPPSVTVPACGSQKRAASFATVDLPEPEGPTSAVRPPSGMVRLTCSSARSSPP